MHTNPNIPPQVLQPFTWIMYLFYGMLLLWGILKLWSLWQRRSYNLTRAERDTSEVSNPDFLKVDHESREAQMQPARARATEPTSAKPQRLAWFAMLLVAIISCLSAIVFAFLSVERLESAWHQFTSWQRIQELFTTFPIGLSAACVLSLGAVLQLLLKFRSNSSS